jgi:hypothetical protein
MSHDTALEADARDQLTPGQVLPAVIIETNVDDDRTALTKHQNIKVFVRPGEEDQALEWGDTVLIKIVDVGPSHAESIAIATAREAEKM